MSLVVMMSNSNMFVKIVRNIWIAIIARLIIMMSALSAKAYRNKKGKLMSLTLANNLYVGCLFIWQGKNYLFKEFTNIVDDKEIVNAIIIDHTGKELSLVCSFDEFKESVVK
jgi:hypothetical protein